MHHQRSIISLLLPLLTTFWAPPGFAGPVGSEFQINTYTTARQDWPKVAQQSDGDFTVVWQGTDTIRSQRFASDGTPIGEEMSVESFAATAWPDLAMAPTGEFVVSWVRGSSNGTDTDSYSVAARRFASDGSPLGDDFQVNSYTTGSQTWARVAMEPDGDFVIVWQSYGSSGTDPGISLQAQRLASDGSFVGEQFQVNEWTTGEDRFPAVAVDAMGNFIVVWSGPIALGDDNDGYSVQARRFGSDGSPVASQFLVNTYTTSDQTFPAVAYQGNGDFVVVWNSYGAVGYPNRAGTRGQRFASDGSRLGEPFQINIPNASYHLLPALDMEPSGDFTVVWSRVASSGSDSDSFSVHSRRFAADATPLEASQQVNTYTSGMQVLPTVAAHDGQTVIVWQSEGSSGTDKDATSIQGQRFRAAADLAVTLSDGVVSAVPGSDLTYHLEASNQGPDGVSGVLVQDTFPSELECSWTSVASGGAKGNTVSSGHLADTLIMPASSLVTYTITCAIDGGATGPLSNTATISSPTPDPDASNDNATDETVLVDPQVILEVDVASPSNVTFRPTPEPSALDVSGISGLHGVTVVSFFDGNAQAVQGETVLCGSVDPLITDGGDDRLGLDTIWAAPSDGGWTLNDLKIFSEAGADIDFSTSAPALVGELSHNLASFQGLPAAGTTGLVVAGPPSNRAILGLWQAQSDNAASGCLVFADGFESGDTSSWNPPSP